MLSYIAPLSEILFTLRHVARLETLLSDGLFPTLDQALTQDLLAQAGNLAEAVIAPLNQPADRAGIRFANGRVGTAPGFAAAYQLWAAGGWNGIAAPEIWGGAGLPVLLNIATSEIHTAASMAFGVGPVLTQAAVDALLVHASADLQQRYLPALVAGTWTAAMNLTEPQAGSDLALIRSRAERAPDGSYRLTGQKIFITWGEHDLTDNIIHLVLARLPDAPRGTKGLSLFLVPKKLVNADGSLGADNDVCCTGVEHKLGLHASPTCSMSFGEQGGAVAWLVGEEHHGLACMFTMMNRARLATGMQGVAVAERAVQQALAYAKSRQQGRRLDGSGPCPIIEHPEVRRQLLTMQSLTAAARSIAYLTAAALDRAEQTGDHAAQQRASLLTPLAKIYGSEVGCHVTSLNMQVHGGQGYIEETGAAQLYRDVRVTPIYEGTNGIQAIDLVTRKLPREGGAALWALAAEWQALALTAHGQAALGATADRLEQTLAALISTARWLLDPARTPTEKLAAATPFAQLFGLAAGCALLTQGALAASQLLAQGDTDPAHVNRIVRARFFAETQATAASGLADTILYGTGSFDPALDPFAV